LKNRRKDRWRDVQNVEADMGHYILSDRPMTEQEWIEATYGVYTKQFDHRGAMIIAPEIISVRKK
jgi:hypothetical protein